MIVFTSFWLLRSLHHWTSAPIVCPCVCACVCVCVCVCVNLLLLTIFTRLCYIYIQLLVTRLVMPSCLYCNCDRFTPPAKRCCSHIRENASLANSPVLVSGL